MAGFGGAVKLTGESEYRQALKNITQNLKEVASEMKLVSAQYSTNDKSTEALSAQSEVLTKKLEQQKSKVELLKKQYSAMSEEFDENKTKHEALAKKYDEAKSKLTTLESTLGATSKEYKEQAEVVEDLETALEKSTKAQDSNERAMSSLRTQLNNAKTDVAKTSNEIETLGEKTEEASDGFTVFKGALADLVSNVISSAINKMQELVSNTIQVGEAFETSMSNVQAISGATDEELQMLSDTAKKFGATTKYSASESADALSYMALAGWDAQTSCEALGGVLNLAAASGMDLASASDLVTDYLSAFGMTAQDSSYFADLLAYAQSNANTTAELLGESYKNCSANLASAGQDIETTTSLLAMMANQGLKGSEAGTALSAVVRDMTSKMNDGAIAIGDTNVAVQDSQGNFRDLTDILADVEKATEGMGTAERASALQATFTADSIKGLNLILNAGVDNASDFENALRSSSGTAEEMAETMNDNLNGDLTALNSKLEGVQIAIYEKFEPALRKGVDALSGLLSAVNFIISHSSEFIAVITAMGTAVGAYVAYNTAMKVMENGWKSLTIVTNAQAVAQKVLNTVMSANPIGIVIASVVGLITAFTLLWNKSEAFRDFWINLWDTIKNVVEPIISGIVTWFTNAWTTIQGAWNMATEFFSNIWNGIMAIFEPVADFFSTLFGNALILIEDVWTLATFFFQTIWDGIMAVFEPVIEFFSGIFSGALDAIMLIWNTATGYFMSIWESIKNIFSPVADFFKNAFSSAWNGIKSVFSSVGNFFGGIWDTIKSKFTNIGQKAGEAIGGAFKSAINAVLKTAESVLNAPIKAINSLLSTINKVPGINLTKLNTFSLPRLAKGGVVDKATIAEIGEAGQEAVVPLENNTGWITKIATQLAKELATPLISATQSVASANNNNNSYNNTVEAFKDALGQMKIVLDDEEMGSFIEKTVADAIYT